MSHVKNESDQENNDLDRSFERLNFGPPTGNSEKESPGSYCGAFIREAHYTAATDDVAPPTITTNTKNNFECKGDTQDFR